MGSDSRRRRRTETTFLHPSHSGPRIVPNSFSGSSYRYVDSAFDSTLRNPETPVVLGIVPGGAELGYGWIEPGRQISNGAKIPIFQISGFWEKPPLHIARDLCRRSCLLNTFVIVGTVSSLIGTIARALPSMYASMNLAQSAHGSALKEVMTQAAYARINRVDFSQSVLARHADKFAVMPNSRR